MRKLCLVCFVTTLAMVSVFSRSAWAQPPIPTTNLLTWLAADDINGDGTNPAEGAAVTTWVDLSGNGNDFSVLTASTAEPAYSSTGGPLGSPAVAFDGINDGLGMRPTFSYTSPQFFVVLKGTPGAAKTRVLGTNGGTYFAYSMPAGGAGIIGAERDHEDAGYRTITLPETPSIADYKILSLYTDIDPVVNYNQWMTAHTLSVGQDVTTVGPNLQAYGTAEWPEFGVTYYPTGAPAQDITLGVDSNAIAWSNISVAEFIMYENPGGLPMVDADRIAVEDYLYNKYMVAAVPEPSTLGLLSIALVGMFASTRRRKSS